jgi:hypothetical protein
MQPTAIDATLRQLAAQIPQGQTKTQTDAFQSLLETLGTQIKAAIADASSNTVSSGATPAATSPASAARTTSQLNLFQQSLLKQRGGTLLEQLSNDLSASDPQYNERESQLRDGLDLGSIEQRLRDSAKSWGVSYDSSDLDGILRNAGYGAANLGSTERYMASIEKFIGEAENNYRQRAGNTPHALSRLS